MTPANFLLRRPSSPIRAVYPIFVLLFISGYGLAFHLSAERFQEEAQLSLAHLTDVIQNKDDMGLIDWSKALEKTDDCLAYDVKTGGTSGITGGNKGLLPKNFIQGLFFQWPSQWCLGWINPGQSYKAILVFQAKPIPWFWGICFGVGASLFYIGILFFFRNTVSSEGIPNSGPSHKESLKNPVQDIPKAVPSVVGTLHSQQPFLLVTKDQDILESSPSVADIFTFFRPGETIFFDLHPTKELTDLIERGEPGRVKYAFKMAPNQEVTIKPIDSGLLLVLESTLGPTTLQNH